MAFFQASEVKLSSGVNGTSTQTIERAQSVSINHSVPRADVVTLGRFKPLANRPVINYTPISFSVEAVKSSKEIESNWGLVNSTGVGVVIGNADTNLISGYGCRNLEFFQGQAHVSTYSNLLTVKSGCLNSYSVNANIGEAARVSFAGEGLDYTIETTGISRPTVDSSTSLVKPENVSITGIYFDGFGLTGFSPQSFGLNVTFTRQAIGYFGRRFPDRPITSAGATISMNGFLEGTIPFTGTRQFDCGAPLTGSMFVTLLPSCSSLPATTYQMVNPYLDTFNLGASVGSFTSVDIGLSIPISISVNEANTGCNLIIL